MSESLRKEVCKLALLIAQELQKTPAKVTPEMLMALRGCAQILEPITDKSNIELF